MEATSSLFEIAKASARLALGIFPRHSARDEPIDAHCQVRRDLVVDLSVDVLAAYSESEEAANAAETRHARSAARMSPTAAAYRAQTAVSRLRCCRPSLVRR